MPTECPHCGEPLARGAISCRECGADAQVGWEDDTEGHADAPVMDDDEYQDFLAREFPGQAGTGRRAALGRTRIVVGVVLLAFALWILGRALRS